MNAPILTPEPQSPPGVYVHPMALLESAAVGEGSRIWAFSHVLPGARIGRDANICDHVFIENDVEVGDRVTIKCGVQLWDGVRIEDDVFVGPNVTFSNDPFPRSKQRPEAFVQTRVRQGASIGSGATIRPGVTIGARALVMDGAVVSRDVPPNAIVAGNPAHITGYVDTPHVDLPGQASATRAAALPADSLPQLSVARATLHRLPKIVDLRGALSFGEIGSHLPFQPQRFFMVYDVPSREVRGEHAHRACHQFLVCVKGSVGIVVDDGQHRDEILLDSARLGLHIPPMVWGIQYQFSPDAVLLVLASDTYCAEDYIRNYDEFLDAVNEAKAADGAPA